MVDRQKVGFIGTGYVGMAAAFSIFQQRLANKLVLVDKNETRAQGEALDVMHGQSLIGRTRLSLEITRLERRRNHHYLRRGGSIQS